MPRIRDVEEERLALRRLKEVPASEAETAVAHALGDSIAAIVERAAEVAAHHAMKKLAPVIVEAFERLLKEGSKADPQCSAKIALATALAAFEHSDPAPFLAGMRHVQPEGWGTPTDTAAALRGICALGYVQCDVADIDVLRRMIGLLNDKELLARIAAARAIAKVGTEAASLMLRLRAELGSDEPELLGACYSGVLSIEGAPAIEWARQFLRCEDEIGAEAAMAISDTHTIEAFRVLEERYAKAEDPWFRKALLSAIALTRQQEATDWLLGLVERSPREAVLAQAALCLAAPSAETLARLQHLGRPCRR